MTKIDCQPAKRLSTESNRFINFKYHGFYKIILIMLLSFVFVNWLWADNAATLADQTLPDQRQYKFFSDNLIANGDFSNGKEFPDAWAITCYGREIVYDKKAGKDGMPAIGIIGNLATETYRYVGTIAQLYDHARISRIHQVGMVLVPGETYKLSGFLKTKNFKDPDVKLARGGFAFFIDGQEKMFEIKPNAANSDWTYFEKIFKLPSLPADKKNATYCVMFYACKSNGEIWGCDVKLQARRMESNPFETSDLQTIYSINLNDTKLAINNPALTLEFPYIKKAEEKTYRCRIAAFRSNESAKPVLNKEFPLKDGQIQVNLHGLSVGDYKLDASIVNKHTGQIICKSQIPIKIVAASKNTFEKPKRLNSLVSELLSTEVELLPGKNTTCTFNNPGEGWIFALVTPSGNNDGVVFSINGAKRGKPVVQDSKNTAPMEAFRRLPAGKQTITFSAKQKTRVKLIVRSISELFYDAPNYSVWKLKMPIKYNWAFMKKHVLPCTTTFLRGVLSDSELEEARSRGMYWLKSSWLNQDSKVDLKQPSSVNADNFAAFLSKNEGFTSPKYDGIAIDEFGPCHSSPANYATYAQALDKLYTKVPADRRTCFWIYGGGPYSKMFFGDFVHTVSKHGLLLFEAYPRTEDTEQKFKNTVVNDFILRMMKIGKQVNPEVQKSMGVIIGTHSLPMDLMQFGIPDVDQKYLLDLTLNGIANSPDFDGLGGIGIYTSGHTDEETLRWICRLMRYYAVEGNKELLSKKYGYKYIPGIIVDCDFAKKTAHWNCVPAEPDSIKFETLDGYGLVQVRYSIQNSAIPGDSVLVTRRSSKAPNKISQPLKGIEPGKLYSVQFVVADYAGIKGKESKSAKYTFKANIEGGQIIPEKSLCCPTTREAALGKNKFFANYQRIVFRATSDKPVLIFSDWADDKHPGGPEGQELAVNFVRVLPYFEE